MGDATNATIALIVIAMLLFVAWTFGLFLEDTGIPSNECVIGSGFRCDWKGSPDQMIIDIEHDRDLEKVKINFSGQLQRCAFTPGDGWEQYECDGLCAYNDKILKGENLRFAFSDCDFEKVLIEFEIQYAEGTVFGIVR